MALYKKRHQDDNETFFRTSDGEIFGADKPEIWAEFQAWLAEGNVPDSADGAHASVPLLISDRQFFQQAALAGLITQADALAAVKTGFIPAPLQAVVDTITDDAERFAAEMLLSGATTIERRHPLVDAVAAAFNMTSADVDAFFIAASYL